jgi:tetratricopeptide (TPR) repeat protein
MVFPTLCLIWIFAILTRKLREKWKFVVAITLVFVFIPASIINASAFKNETHYFLKALESFPEDSYLLFQAGLAYFNKEDYLSADLYLNKTLSLPTRPETAHLVRVLNSEIDFKKAKYDNVKRWLETEDDLQPSQYHQLPPLIRFQNKLTMILIDIYKGDSETAESLLLDMITEYPERSESYRELYRLYMGHNRWDDARRVEMMVEEKFPYMNDLDTDQVITDFHSFNTGEKIAYFIQNRNFGAAIDIINTLSPLDLEHKILLAKLHYWRGDEDEAERTIRSILQEQPESDEVLNRIGTFYLQDLFRVQQAMLYFAKSLKINSAQPNIEFMVRRLKEDYLQKIKTHWPEM